MKFIKLMRNRNSNPYVSQRLQTQGHSQIAVLVFYSEKDARFLLIAPNVVLQIKEMTEYHPMSFINTIP